MEVRYPPPLKRGISVILARYPMKTRQMGAIPRSALLSRKGIARYGGVSRIGPQSPDPSPGMSHTKTLCKVPFSVVLDRDWPGCPAIWVGTSRDRKHFMQENRKRAEYGFGEYGFKVQTPNSVSFSALAELRENSVSSFWPIICVPKRTH